MSALLRVEFEPHAVQVKSGSRTTFVLRIKNRTSERLPVVLYASDPLPPTVIEVVSGRDIRFDGHHGLCIDKFDLDEHLIVLEPGGIAELRRSWLAATEVRRKGSCEGRTWRPLRPGRYRVCADSLVAGQREPACDPPATVDVE
jgi:hypothetical protein